VISKSDLEIGIDYQIFTISFDHTEKTKLGIDKKKTYSKLVKGNHDLKNGWIYFTGDSTNISNLLNGIGYHVKKEGEEFIHPAALVVLVPVVVSAFLLR